MLRVDLKIIYLFFFNMRECNVIANQPYVVCRFITLYIQNDVSLIARLCFVHFKMLWSYGS